MDMLRIESLPEAAVDAAAEFHAKWLPEIRARLDAAVGALALVMPAAPYDHDDWRGAVVRDLARAYTPKRVVLIAGNEESAIADTLSYLANAPGITGQYLKLD